MEIKFTTAYEVNTPQIFVQAELLDLCRGSLAASQMKAIKKASIEFVSYGLAEYYDQDKVKKAITNSGTDESKVDEVYKSLVEQQTQIMELIIVPEGDY